MIAGNSHSGTLLAGPEAFRTRSYGHSDHVCDECGEPDEAGKVSWLFLVACGDAAAVFDSSKESFDEIAVFVDRPVVSPFLFASGIWLDAHLCPELSGTLANRV